MLPKFDNIHKLLIILAAALGIVVGWLARAPAKPVHEAAAPATRQADGSLVLARAEGTTTPPAAPHALPKGAVEERRVQVVVQPPRGVVRTAEGSSPVPDHFAGAGNKVDSIALNHLVDSHEVVDSCDCAPVTVDLSLVRFKDRTRRVVASSPDGTVLSGLDIPIEAAPEIRVPLWTLSAIAVADFEGIRPGALLTRRFGPVVLGCGALVDPALRRPGAIIQAGITW